MKNNQATPRYSVVVPMYNEMDVIDTTYIRLTEVMKGQGESYELIFVDDGSRDSTIKVLEIASKNDNSVRIIPLSRNFGHQSAVTAGLDHALGDAVIIIDADLQDPPEVISQMIKMWQCGYDVVYGKRKERRGETFFKKFTAVLFYRLLNRLTEVKIPLDTGDFRLIDRKVCDALTSMDERNRFIRGLISWVGFTQCPIEYEREERYAGVTKYPLKKMVKFAMDGIVAFSNKPLKAAGLVGFSLVFGSSLALITMLFTRLFANDSGITGWMFSLPLIVFVQGIVLLCIGLLGEYIGRLFDETRKRPVYILRGKSRTEQLWSKDRQ